MNINPITPRKPPKSPEEIAARAEQIALRKRELESAANTDAADQTLEDSEMTAADSASAPALKAASKKARVDRKQATQVAIAKARDAAAAMPPPPKPGIQAKDGRGKKKTADAAPARIKRKKPPEAAVPSDNTDADERTGSDAGSEAPSRAGNAKVGNTPRTTAHCSPALSAHTCTSQTTSNLTCTAQITLHSPPLLPMDSPGVHRSNDQTRAGHVQPETKTWGLYLQPPEQSIPNPLEGWRSPC